MILKSLLFISSLMCLCACSNSTALTMVCGTYTDSGSYGVYSAKFDDGEIIIVDSAYVRNPSYLDFSQDNSKIYAVSEFFDSAKVNTIAFNPQTLRFGEVTSVSGCGDNPCYITMVNGRVVTADYSGSSVSVFDVAQSGVIEKLHGKIMFDGRGPDSVRQSQSHIHCVVSSPRNNVIYATDLGADRIYRIDHRTVDTIQLPGGCGPRHLVFSPTAAHAYLVCELSGEVMFFENSVDTLLLKQTEVCDSLRQRASADIHISADGRFLYASNRRKGDGIARFEVAADGKLTYSGYTFTGRHPRNFIITPDDRYLLVACRDDNAIEVYSRNISNGSLTLRSRCTLPKPVCLKFAR